MREERDEVNNEPASCKARSQGYLPKQAGSDRKGRPARRPLWPPGEGMRHGVQRALKQMVKARLRGKPQRGNWHQFRRVIGQVGAWRCRRAIGIFSVDVVSCGTDCRRRGFSHITCVRQHRTRLRQDRPRIGQNRL